MTTNHVPTTIPLREERAPWGRLLDGDDADSVRAAVIDIADGLRHMPADVEQQGGDASVSNGKAGLALFFAELGRTMDDEAAIDHASDLIDEAIELSQAQPYPYQLFSGPVSVGWALDVLAGRLFEPDDDESDVDALVEGILGIPEWTGPYDLIGGIVGLGTYALRRLPRPVAVRSVGAAIDKLATLADRRDEGTSWRTVRSMLADIPVVEERMARHPDGYFDTGLAHGHAGVMVFLAAAAAAGFAEARPLLADATRWILAHRLDHDHAHDMVFPLLVEPSGATDCRGRVAWCYGDPSVAIALLAAGRALGDDALVATAADVAYDALSLPVEATGVVDAGLCHGSAGLAHVAARLGWATGDERLLDQARRWIAVALSQRADEGIGGFLAYQLLPTPGYRALPGLLEGAAGIGLALLASVTDSEPVWDDFLLLSPVSAR
jgi:lantibiotic modifying enzyme